MMVSSTERNTMDDNEKLIEYAEQCDIANDPLVVDLVAALRTALGLKAGA